MRRTWRGWSSRSGDSDSGRVELSRVLTADMPKTPTYAEAASLHLDSKGG